MRRRNRMVKLVEYIKVASLLAILVICAASWFIDPFAPTGSGPRGYLGINFDTGFNLNKLCQPIAKEADDCRAKFKKPQVLLVDSDTATSGWMSFLNKARGMEEEKTREQSQYPAQCTQLTAKVNECRQQSRTTKEQIQLRCIPQITAQWECKNSGVSRSHMFYFPIVQSDHSFFHTFTQSGIPV